MQTEAIGVERTDGPHPMASVAPPGREQRHTRVLKRLPVAFDPGGRFERDGFAKNVSAGGLFITCAHVNARGESIFLRIKIAYAAPIDLDVVVVWSRQPLERGTFGSLSLRVVSAYEAYFQLLLGLAPRPAAAQTVSVASTS